MNLIAIQDLPPPPVGKTGFPWTEAADSVHPLEANLPKISIITPSFNQGQYIEATIRSILLQNYPNLEYIVIDGGSTDETVAILQKYDKWIYYWVSEPDDGQSDALNKGLAKATGTVFNWLNSDDYYLPNALQTVGQAFKQNDLLNVFCGREVVLPPNALHPVTQPRNPTVVRPTLEETIAIGTIHQPPTFFRLSVFRQLGAVPTALYFCMDAALWLNYLTQFGLENIAQRDAILNVFRLHNHSKSMNSNAIYYSDRFNLLNALVQSSVLKKDFPQRFLKRQKTFNLYFEKKFNLERTNERLLLSYIAQQLLAYYSQWMSWRAFFELYFYALSIGFWNRPARLYFAPFIKWKRVFIPIPLNLD
ncbi:MAG: hypothetical protein RLZZ628_1025 [Bacteroidota bacterium]|jgi:glycosyltransferase involved in cell wall biosynthesis